METAAWARSVAFDAEESEDVREEAFTAWAGHPTVTVAYLADLYGEISEPFLKMQAIYAIFERADADSEAPRVLMELIRNEPDHEVRERGIYWLGRTGSEEAVDFLLELLTPPGRRYTASYGHRYGAEAARMRRITGVDVSIHGWLRPRLLDGCESHESSRARCPWHDPAPRRDGGPEPRPGDRGARRTG